MRIIIYLLPILSTTFLFAQKTDSLRAVKIKDYRTSIKSEPIITLDSSVTRYHSFQNLQQILDLHSNLFIKNHGIGGFATVSLRGASAAQTQFQWQGMNINNAQTGLSDISQFPNSFFDQIQIHSNAIDQNVVGGLIKLGNVKPLFEKHISAKLGIGYESLNNTMLQAGVQIANSKMNVCIKYFQSKSQNRFSFYNSRSERMDTMRHAENYQRSVMADFYIKPNKKNALVSFHTWYQITDRNIPAAIFENDSKRSDSARSFRNILKWESKIGNINCQAHVGYIYDQYAYADKSIHLFTQASSQQVPAGLNIEWLGNRQRLQFKTLNHYSQLINTEEFTNNTLFNLTYEAEPKRLNLTAKMFVQKEFSNLFSLPVIGGISVRKRFLKNHYLFTSLNSSYRLPTLNELFFEPGGNKNLKPELGKNFTIGLEHRISTQRHVLKMQNECFYRNVSNWIMWYGGAILTPHNMAEVHSRGLESMLNYSYLIKPEKQQTTEPGKTFGKSRYRQTFDKSPQLHTQVLYSYTIATTKKSFMSNDYSIGKQIPYVPRYQLRFMLGYSLQNLRIDYAYHYTGYRFVTTDETQYLIPYNTHHILASYRLQMSNSIKCEIICKVNNLLNQYYESVVGRPQAGRTFLIGIHTTWR